MTWPWFVSAARLRDAQGSLTEARTRIVNLELEIKQLNNQIVFRSTGVPLYPDMEVLPERLIPRQVPAAAVPVRLADDEPLTPVQEAMKATGSRNPRVIAHEISRRNIAAHASMIFAVPRPAAAREAIPVTSEQKQDFAAAAEDLTKAAG